LDEHRQRQQLQQNFTDNFRICNSIRDTSIDRRKKLYSKNAWTKIIKMHDFRHTHASVLANAGINIQEIARRLGHSRIEMTWNTYCHLYPREEEKAIAVLNRVDNFFKLLLYLLLKPTRFLHDLFKINRK